MLALMAIPAVGIAAAQGEPRAQDPDRPTPRALSNPLTVPMEPFVAVEPPAGQPDNDTPGTADEISCGTTWWGTVDYAGDIDYFTFYGYGGDTFSARIFAAEWGTGLDPTMTLYDIDGNSVMRYVDDYDGLDPIINVTLPGDGYFYLAVGGYGGNSVGDYYINLESPVYMSMSGAGKINGMSYKNGDVLVYNSCGGYWDMFLNAKSLGFKGNLTGLALLPDRTALVTFASTQKNYGQVSAYDIAQCYLYDVGWDSAWSCSMFFDGSDVGLTKGSEKIKSIGVSPYGTLLMSFQSRTQVPGVPGFVENEDILEFDAVQYGPNTAGNWYMFFDGSDQGLSKVQTEGLWMNSYWWDVYHTFEKRVVLPGGDILDKGDIGLCYPSWLGDDTQCNGWWKTFDGTDAGMKKNSGIDAIDLGEAAWLQANPYPAPQSIQPQK